MSAARTGPTSFGYRREGARLVADPTEAPIRRRMFELFAEHQRKKTVAEILNAEGARTRNDAYFTGQTVGRLLEDENVVGVRGSIDALVPKELFERCKTILASQRQTGGAKRKAVHLFSGMVFCRCGEKMYVPSNSDKYVCGQCRTKIPTDDLEAVFVTQLADYEVSSLDEIGSKTLSEMNHFWSKLPFEDRREIVECMTQRVEIADKKVTCFLIAL